VTHRVLIAGSGVAAVEAVLALRHLAGRAFELELLAPVHALEHRPASVAAPFGLGAPPPLDLHELARRYHVQLVEGELAGVDVDRRRARLATGDDRDYDFLLVAVGARAEAGLPGALTFRGPADVPAVERVLAEVARGHRRQVVVVVPSGATWALPAYELAIMIAAEARGVADATVSLVTHERAPLWIFGDAAGEAMRELLSERGIELHAGVRATRVTDDVLWLGAGRALDADTAISLPVLTGPRIPGLPSDADGFLPADAHGYVMGAPHVLAAGDAASFPIKQGGLATQQADAAAATIANALGAPVVPAPFAPVLRGLLLTGGAPVYLRAELDAGGGLRPGEARSRRLAGEVSSRALWWPPGKVAGRYLAPYLATARPVALGEEPLVDRVPGRASAADAGEHGAALELALMVADEDAAAGDPAHALHALDAAAALSGGVLPAAYSERRERWLAEIQAQASTSSTSPCSSA
jgi:sulfide:quinone oxidoreductase